MNQPQSNTTILNGPSGELTMAFKEAQKTSTVPTNQPNFRPQLLRTDSRVGGQSPQPPAQQHQQFQGQPRPYQANPAQPGQQFRPPQNFAPNQQQPQRFGQPPSPNQGPPQGGPPGQPLFRPQQRFVAVNPPGTVRPNFRPPGPPFQRPQRPPGPGLPQQQSFTGALPFNKSQEGVELQRSNTLDSDVVQAPLGNDVKHEEKEEIKHHNDIVKPQTPAQATPPSQSPVPAPHVIQPQVAAPQPQIEVKPQESTTPTPTPPPSTTPSLSHQVGQPQNQQVHENVVNSAAPPNTLPLHHSVESKNSSSPSPQPESVIEVKPKSKPKTEAIAQDSGKTDKERAKTDKPPRVPKTPTRSGIATRTPSKTHKKEGDNDSGVDESTQGNDHSTNGDHSPRKTVRNSSRLATPTKNRSFSRGSRSPHLMSPDSQPGTPGPTDKKKIPMNKIQVGFAPSPNLKVVKSKIGSLSNANYKPGGGHVKIETKKVDVSQATSRIGAKNDAYAPSGGDKKIQSQKLQWNAKSKIGSLENTSHKPKGGDKKIESVKLDFKDKAKPKVGSKDNMTHVAGGGDIKHEETDLTSKQAKEKVNENQKQNEHETLNENAKVVKKQQSVKIIDRKLNVQAESKIGSLDNMKHKPGGGEKKIFDDKDYLRQKSAGGMSNENDSMCGSQNSLPSQHSQHSDSREPVSDENLNREN